MLITLSDIVGKVFLRDSRGDLEVSLSFVGTDIRLLNNRSGIIVFDNTIDDSMHADGNDDDGVPIDIELNKLKADIQCSENAPDPVGSNNTVEGSAQGQCVGFD